MKTCANEADTRKLATCKHACVDICKEGISLSSVRASTERVNTESTHAIFISVGFGMLRKETKLMLSFITTEAYIFIGFQ